MDKVDQTVRDASSKAKGVWHDAGVEAEKIKRGVEEEATRAEAESNKLNELSKDKCDEASKLRDEASSLGTSSRDIEARKIAAGKSPGLMDRIRAGYEHVKESASEAYQQAKGSMATTAKEGRERVEEVSASAKEKLADTMESASENAASSSAKLKESAADTREQAAATHAQAQQQAQAQHAQAYSSSSPSSLGRTGPVGSTTTTTGGGSGVGSSLKESLASGVERGAAKTSEKAKDIEHAAGEKRHEAHMEKERDDAAAAAATHTVPIQRK